MDKLPKRVVGWYLWSLFTFISVPCLDINLQFSDQILPNFIFSQI
jgi:hypothetical protein